MLKIGVVGAGHLGKIHLKLLADSKKFNLVGFFDPDKENSEKLQQEFGYRSFSSYDELLEKVDVVDIVTPTPFHFKIAQKAVEQKKHVFIEKPVTDDIKTAQELEHLIRKYGVKAQVGHVERFNPAFLAAKSKIKSPMFIECHRLAMFNPRGNDVPVVLDLMIHDIDLILNIVKSPIKSIDASGTKVVSSTPDIANARIVFENSCVANITTSRISMKNMRKLRIFQKDAYISLDLFKKEGEIITMEDAPQNPSQYDMIMQNYDGKNKKIIFEKLDTKENNAILNELESFAISIEENRQPPVTISEASKALSVALQIVDEIEKNSIFD